MRLPVVFVTLLALAAPFAATASVRAPGDGTLAVQNLDGRLIVAAKGAVIGRCTQCTLVLDERYDDSVINPVVSGARGTDMDDDGDKDRFVGRNLRWKVIGGSFLMRVTKGVDVDVSLVARGLVRIRGTDGVYFVNDSVEQMVTSEGTFIQLRATTQP
jgi:hypothetical protein